MKKVYNLLKRYYIFTIVILLMGSTTGAFAQPTANAGLDKSICENKTLSLSGATASGYDDLLWETDGNGTFGPSATVLNPVYYPGGNDSGSVELTLTASATGFSDAVDAMILVIFELPVPYAGVDATVCNGNNYQISGATITGGSSSFVIWTGGFDGVFVNPTDLNPEYQPGPFDLLNGEVTLNLVVTPSSPCVSVQSDEFVLTFSDEISADAGADGTICADGTFNVSGSTVNATTFTWSTDGGDGTFDNANALSTFYTPGDADVTAGGVTIILTAENQYCDPVEDELYLTVDPLPEMTCPTNFDVCISSDPVTLTGGLPAGGTYSGTGVTGNVFDPSVGADTYTITYSYTDPGTGCSNECTFEITVNALPIVDCPGDDTVCEDESSFDLTGATPAGGDYSGTGVDANSFDPAVAGVGTHTITYVYTDPVTSCTDSCDFEIEVAAAPTVNAGDDQTVCEDVDVQLNATVNNQCSIIWAPVIGNGTFDDGGIANPVYTPGALDYITGSATLSINVGACDPCSNGTSDFVTIYFTKPPVADAGTGGTICEDGTFALSGSVENACGNTWTSADQTGSFDDDTDLTTNYTPGTADIAGGFATLTLTAEACDPCLVEDTDDVIIYIQKGPTVDILFEKDTVCENTVFDFAGKVNYSEKSAVVWYTGNGSNNWDNNNADFPKYTVSLLDALQGVINIIVTVSPLDPCTVEAVDSCKLYIQPLPVVKAGDDKTVCEDASISLSDASVLFSDDVLWEDVLAGDGTFDDATDINTTFTPGPNAITLTFTQLKLTAQPIDPCTSEISDEVTITISYLPVVSAGDDATICEDGTHQVDGSVDIVCGSPTFVWTTSGSGSFDNANSLTATYTPSQDDIDDESVYLILTGEPCSPCVTRPADSLLLTIQPLPDVDAGVDQTVCEDETVYLDGTIGNQCSMQWSTFGDGDFNNTDIEDPEYEFGFSDIQNGSVKLLFAGGACSPCATGIYDTMLVTIQLAPVADAGEMATICEDATYTLQGSVENASGQIWSVVFGGGTFDDSGLLNAEYTPGAEAILAGYAELKLTANPIEPCQNDGSDNVIITVQNNPTVDILFEKDTVCENTEYDFAK